MRISLLPLVPLGAFLLGSDARATDPPQTVSPGDTERVARAADRCPTFSWGAVPEAAAFRLAVYDTTEETAEPVLVVSRELPGSVSSWTPSLESCLLPGRLYAWRVGAVDTTGEVTWSSPSWFEVEPQLLELPSNWVDQVVERLTVGSGGGAAGMPVTGTTARGLRVSVPAQTASRMAKAASTFSVGSSGAVTAGAIAVDGAVTALAFVGDGSGLTGVASGTGGIENTGSTTIGADTDDDGVGVIALQTRTVTRVVIANDGKVGVGTAIPAERLDVNGRVKVEVGGSASKVVCWKADGMTLGYCSTQPDATGGCTCN